MDRLRLPAPDGGASGAEGVLGITFSELIGALSHALDLTEGQPKGHCIRVCWIGSHIGRKLGLGLSELRELYYTLLLKDLGCSSNAARICELYLTDDLSFKRDFKTVGEGLPDVLRFVFSHTGLNAGHGGPAAKRRPHPSRRHPDHRRPDQDPLHARRRHRPAAPVR